MPNIGSCRASGALLITWMCPALRKASPSEVPIQTTPAESRNKQFTSWEGNPSASVYVLQVLPASSLTPLGVPNHIVPFGLSAIEEIVLEARPLLVVNVVKWPSLSLLSPRLRVPDQTVLSAA